MSSAAVFFTEVSFADKLSHSSGGASVIMGESFSTSPCLAMTMNKDIAPTVIAVSATLKDGQW
jgi:hypothetical protein